jgi:hypothetical protein
MKNDLFQLVREVAVQFPSLLALLVCLVIALVRWNRHPRISLVASLAFVLLMLHGLFFAAIYIWIPHWLGEGTAESHRTFYYMFGLFATVLFAIAMAILLVAVFIDRKQASI